MAHRGLFSASATLTWGRWRGDDGWDDSKAESTSGTGGWGDGEGTSGASQPTGYSIVAMQNA